MKLPYGIKSALLHGKLCIGTSETKKIHAYPGLEIVTDTVANASATFNLATKNSSLVATLATMFLW